MSDQESSNRLEARTLDSVEGSASEVSPEPEKDATAGDPPKGELPAVASSQEEPPADESPADESPADESPADESPADESAADESPADASPADESPAEGPPDEPADSGDGGIDGIDEGADRARAEGSVPVESAPLSSPRAGRKGRGQDAPVFFVAGFWHRWVAAALDLAIIVPVVLLLYAATSRVGGVALPGSRHYGVDFWLDLLLEGDPALITLVALLVAVATIYVLVFQIILSHTPGMRVMKIRIVDQYGASPSTARSAARSAGYVASAATLGLGFIWIGFDSEKRGLHDWLSGTYVVRV